MHRNYYDMLLILKIIGNDTQFIALKMREVHKTAKKYNIFTDFYFPFWIYEKISFNNRDEILWKV